MQLVCSVPLPICFSDKSHGTSNLLGKPSTTNEHSQNTTMTGIIFIVRKKTYYSLEKIVSALFILKRCLLLYTSSVCRQEFLLQKLTLPAARKNCLPDPWRAFFQGDLDKPFLKYGTQQAIGDV